MTIEMFLKLNPDFAGSVDKANGYWIKGFAPKEVTYWHLLAEVPSWIFNEEYVEWSNSGWKNNNGTAMGDFMEDNPPDETISAIVAMVRGVLNRKPPAVDYKYTRAQLVKELIEVAGCAIDEGETYYPQNAWAIALYQAAAIVAGDEHAYDDEIIQCNAQSRKLNEGRGLSGEPGVYEPL